VTLQNRVTPFGDIVAIRHRGLFTGNRGILHDPATKTLLVKRWATKAWIACSCDYQGVRRTPMGGRSWTELFFLDEAVALSAGHRPCFLCRRPAAQAFRQAWARAKGEAPTGAAQMDEILHAERLDRRAKRIHPLEGPIGSLPDGSALAAGTSAYIVAGGKLFAWSDVGYRPAPMTSAVDGLLTPPSTLGALRSGYRPVLHPSLAEANNWI
jgi:hypothetical protein